MTTVLDVLAVLEAFAPVRWTRLVHSRDNIGLLVGRRSAAVTHVLVALDVTGPVIREARDIGAQLIVAHHPVVYGEGVRAITDATMAGSLLMELIENKLAAICMHTNLDAAPGGINDLLARAVGLENEPDILGSSYHDLDGRRFGLGRVGMLPTPLSPGELAASVKTALGCRGVRYVDGGRPCQFVAVGSGNSCSQWDDVLQRGCDAFITGDVKYNLFLEAQRAGVTLIDAGHFPTEYLIVPWLAAFLRDKLPGLEIIEAKVKEEPTIWI